MTENMKYEEKVIGLLTKIVEQTQPKESKKESSEPAKAEEHSHFKEGDEICPTCYPAVSKTVIQKELKEADFECEECGLPVKGEQSGKSDWECKNCGHKYAKPKD